MSRLLKERMKQLAVMCIAGCLVLSWAGCGASTKTYDSAASISVSAKNSSASADMGGGYYAEDTYAQETELELEDGEAGEESFRGETSDSAVTSNRKLIKTVDMNVETQQFEAVMSNIEAQVAALGGYIENMETYNGSTYSGYRSLRNANMTLRLPKDRLGEFLAVISDISNVVRRSENVEDVTLAYVDIQSRRNALQTEQDRLLALLGQAESIEDIITIEERLSNVRYELESMESRLRTYDNKVDYSTVYLYIDEVRELTPVAEESVWQQIVSGFLASLRNIGNGFVEFAIWFVVHIPYMIIWAIVIAAVILLCKGIGKRKRRKKQKKQENENQ